MRSSSIASTILLSLASAAIVFAAPISDKREEDFRPCTVHCNAQGVCYESGPGCDFSRDDQLTEKREEDFRPCTVHCNAQGVCYESGPGCDFSHNDQLTEKREEDFGLKHPCHVVCDADGKCECITTDFATTEKRNEDLLTGHPCYLVCDAQGHCKCLLGDEQTVKAKRAEKLECIPPRSTEICADCVRCPPGWFPPVEVEEAVKEKRFCIPKCVGEQCSCETDDEEAVKEKKFCIPKCVGEQCSCEPDDDEE